MAVFDISGGRRLSGEIRISGAKNSVLPLLASTVLFRGPCVLHNCPRLSDVDAAVAILRHLGCQVEREDHDIFVDSWGVNRYDIPRELMGKMRSSVLFLGPLLARMGACRLYAPGGCALGARPIDLHLMGLRAMGAELQWQGDELICRAKKLRGCTVTLPFPSVGATENLMLAAMGAGETVTLFNVAREPEIGDLAAFLRGGGGRVYGAGTGMVQIEGGPLRGARHRVIPDRIETATYLCAVAAAGGEALLRGTDHTHLTEVLRALSAAGCALRKGPDHISVAAGDLTGIPPVRTGPYPAFPTDAQAPLMGALLRARGTTVFEENIFSDRFRHVPALRALGGNIGVCGSIAAVSGVKSLRGARMEATDLRGGAAMVVAALGAQGTSRVDRVEHILRGYESLPEKLRALGAEIRVTEEQEADQAALEDQNGSGRTKPAGPGTIRGPAPPDPAGASESERPAAAAQPG